VLKSAPIIRFGLTFARVNFTLLFPAPPVALEAAESGVYNLAMTLTRNDLLSRLDALGIVTTTVDHPAVFTVEESKRLRGDLLGAHTKNLFLKDKKGHLWLVVALEDRDVDLKALRKEIGAAQLSFGKPDLLSKVLGLEPGSVTPFGVINDTGGQVTVILDKGLLAFDVLNFHPLTNTATTQISPEGLQTFLRDTRHKPTIIAL
jgi:Ala-tRNA(Pro) deacylase